MTRVEAIPSWVRQRFPRRLSDAPKQAAGTVAINGALDAAAGTVSIDIGGTAASQYGRVSVTGAATLSGTLNLAVGNGFSPAIGNTFPVLTYGSRTGQFTTINGLTIGNGNQFTPTYNATNLTLGVSAAPAPPARFDVTIARDAPFGAPAMIAPGQVLQLSALTRRADGLRFRFPAEAGRTYRLEGRADLVTGDWLPLLEIQGTGEVLELLDTEAPTLSRYFYRIILLP